MAYHSESDKVKDMPFVMQYVIGKIIDIGCGSSKITPNAMGVDGRPLEGVDLVTDDAGNISDVLSERDLWLEFDTVFSSHFLEHLADQYCAVASWAKIIRSGGHLVLYLPDGDHYNNQENPEHMVDMKYEPFMFWFKRAFCGEGKDFRGNNLPKVFEMVDSGLDIGEDRYSFYLICRKV
jgi:SAM-dependent methyltransferase